MAKKYKKSQLLKRVQRLEDAIDSLAILVIGLESDVDDYKIRSIFFECAYDKLVEIPYHVEITDDINKVASLFGIYDKQVGSKIVPKTNKKLSLMREIISGIR